MFSIRTDQPALMKAKRHPKDETGSGHNSKDDIALENV